jgi:hypothetical protein
MAMSIDPKARAIHLHIDQLVLHGFTQIDAAALSGALKHALGRELNLSPTWNHAARPHAQATVRLPERCGSERLGGSLGQALAGVIRGSCGGDTHG